MRLLDRYLFRELLTPFAVCLVVIQGLVIFITIFSDLAKIQDAKLHFLETIEYAAGSSLDLMTIVLPVSLLLGPLWALTQHARYNEITAMRAAGISLWRICLPYFIVALFSGGVLFVLNESLIPRGADFAERLLNRYTGMPAEKTRGLDFTNGREHRNWIAREYEPGTGQMQGVKVEWKLPDGSDSILTAERGLRTNGVWTFFNAQELIQPNPAVNTYIPIMSTNVLAMPEFNETPEEIRVEMQVSSYLNLNKHDPDLPLTDIIPYLQWHPNLSRLEKGRLLTELHERIAMPLTCLVVPLIAIPFGAAPGRRNLFVGVAGSIFIFFVYYVLQHVGAAFGSSGTWPAWLGAWLPNLFFALLGLILMMRIR